MPRAHRVFEPELSLHAIHRGNNRTTMFVDDSDFLRFLFLLRTAAGRYGVRVHAYALMTNHYHLLVTPDDRRALARTMLWANGRYVHYFNRKHDRIGTLFNGRFRAIPIGDRAYWLACLRYIELNPVRAGMVSAPESYRWTSYRVHAHGQVSSWIADHPAYLALGDAPAARRAAYRAHCAQAEPQIPVQTIGTVRVSDP